MKTALKIARIVLNTLYVIIGTYIIVWLKWQWAYNVVLAVNLLLIAMSLFVFFTTNISSNIPAQLNLYEKFVLYRSLLVSLVMVAFGYWFLAATELISTVFGLVVVISNRGSKPAT